MPSRSPICRSAFRCAAIQRHAPAQESGREIARHQVGIVTVGSVPPRPQQAGPGSRRRCGARRNRLAASKCATERRRRDLDQLDGRDLQRQAAAALEPIEPRHLGLIGAHRLAVADHATPRGAAHVESQRPWQAKLARHQRPRSARAAPTDQPIGAAFTVSIEPMPPPEVIR